MTRFEILPDGLDHRRPLGGSAMRDPVTQSTPVSDSVTRTHCHNVVTSTILQISLEKISVQTAFFSEQRPRAAGGVGLQRKMANWFDSPSLPLLPQLLPVGRGRPELSAPQNPICSSLFSDSIILLPFSRSKIKTGFLTNLSVI